MEEEANLSHKIESCLKSGQLTGMGKIYDKVSWNSFSPNVSPQKKNKKKTDPLKPIHYKWHRPLKNETDPL